MGTARRVAAALVVAWSILLGARGAHASVDVTGSWGVQVNGFLGPELMQFDFQQTGTDLVLTISFLGPLALGSLGPITGTIDPDTGVFYIDLPDTGAPFPGFPPCPDNRIDGTASADGTSIGGSYTSYFFHATPPVSGCLNAGGPFNGTRCAAGTPGCCENNQCCGNGTIQPGEECDTGPNTDLCCSSTCHVAAAGTSCRNEPNACTNDVCDGAGTCQHTPNSASCGDTCRPDAICVGGACVGDPAPPGTSCSDACRPEATCVDGSCATGTPAPAGTPCDDGNLCTGDHCSGAGFCLDGGGTANCGPCERCDAAAGCITGPQPCISSSASRLTLAVPSPAAAKLAWSQEDTATFPGIFGNPAVDTDYTLCAFDGTGLVFHATAPADGTCHGKPCWKPKAGGSFQYRDPERTPDGLERLDLGVKKHGAVLKVKGKGPGLQLPASLLDIAPPLVVQLQARDGQGGRCWQSAYGDEQMQRTARTLKARTP